MDCVQVEAINQVRCANRSRGGGQAKRVGEAPNDLFRLTAGLSKRLDRARTEAFRKAPAVAIDHQAHVSKAGHRLAERAVERDLSRRRGKQIRAANDFGDLGIGIVNHDRELVRPGAVRTT